MTDLCHCVSNSWHVQFITRCLHESKSHTMRSVRQEQSGRLDSCHFRREGWFLPFVFGVRHLRPPLSPHKRNSPTLTGSLRVCSLKSLFLDWELDSPSVLSNLKLESRNKGSFPDPLPGVISVSAITFCYSRHLDLWVEEYFKTNYVLNSTENHSF